MFEIDLLKGQGVPVTSRPINIILGVVTLIIPTAVLIFGFTIYSKNQASMSIIKSNISNYNRKIAELSEPLKIYRKSQQEKKQINQSLAEVAECIDRHKQWSHIVFELTQKLPKSVILTELELNQNYETVRVAKKSNPS